MKTADLPIEEIAALADLAQSIREVLDAEKVFRQRAIFLLDETRKIITRLDEVMINFSAMATQIECATRTVLAAAASVDATTGGAE